MKKSFYCFIFLFLICASVFLYGNCSPNHSNVSGESLNLSVECGDLKSLFAQTYRPFLQTTCNQCHITGGRGKGSFADSNLETAWAAFQFAGYSKISNFAVSPSHNPPYTGVQNSARIQSYKEAWLTGLEEKDRCKPGEGSGSSEDDLSLPRYNTVAKQIGLASPGQSKVIEWNLNTELSADTGLVLPALPGAILSIKVEVVDVLGQISYYVSEPRIKNSTVDIAVKGIRTKLNGNFIPGETTFKFVEKNVYNRTDTLLSAGTMVALGQNNVSDTMALSFEDIDVVVLPPPDLGPTINFTLASQTRDERNFVDVEISLSREPARAVIVQVEMRGTSTAKQRRSSRSTDEPYDFFDWDVTFGTVAEPANLLSLTFVPGGALTQTVRVLISDDQRHETNENAILYMSSIENAVLGTNQQHTLTITDNDAAPSNPFVKTFSQLMTGNGILSRRCLECHNTVLKEGGYDMTDYSSMISSNKRILVPGNPLESEMYKRLRLSGPGRMPLDQALDSTEQREIENWITSGATNN